MIDVPIVFGRGRGLFGVLTLPEAKRRGRGVVVCAPFGYPNVCSYRPLRTLARRIGAQGWPVLRFDWPGTGDSGDPDRADDPLHAWMGALAEAIAELRARAGVADIGLVGLGIGATLALAYAEGEIDVSHIALLDPCVSGQDYLHASRGSHALAETLSADPELVQPTRPDGGVEMGGFLVPRREVEALSSLDLGNGETASLAGRRVLVFTSHEDHAVGALVGRFAAAGAIVTHTMSNELAHAWEAPATSTMTNAVGSVVCGWLASAGDAASSARPSRDSGEGAPATRPTPKAVDGQGWRERPLVLETDHGRMVGIICEPAAQAECDDWVVFLNAGKVRRIGPSRMATDYARAWAKYGLPSLRLDLPGVGDSAGELPADEHCAEHDSGWYEKPSFELGARAALRWLATERAARRFDLVGLGTGAFWCFQVARAEARVAGVSLLNPSLLLAERRVPLRNRWMEIPRMTRNPRSWAALHHRRLGSLPLVAALTIIGRGDAVRRDMILASLAKLRSRGTNVGIVFSDGDPGIGYFQRHLGPDCQQELERSGATVEVIRGADHTFSPLWSRDVLRQALERQLGEIGFLDFDVDSAVA